MGGHAPHGQHDASDARFVACPGKAEGRKEAERPPALQALPRPHSQRKWRTPPPPPSPPPSAGAYTARQCPVASEMACRPWGIPRGRGVQTQAQAVVACLPLFSLPTGRSATRRDIPSSRARRPAIRRCGGPSSSTLHVSRRSGGASVRPLPPCTSVGDLAVLPSASYPCARQSAIRRCRTPPSPLSPCPGPVHVDWGLPARATRFTTHSPTLGTGFIADGTPKTRKRLPRPSSESVGLQSSSAGVRSQALVLLGSLHVELSSWRRGNHPPLQQLAPPPIPVDQVEVSFVLPPTLEKQNTWEPPTPAAVRTVTCTRTGRREASSGIRRDRWETTDHGVRTSSFAARAGCATSRAAAF